MFPAPHFRVSTFGGRATLVALLVLVCFFGLALTAEANPNDPGLLPAGSAVVAGLNNIMGNRTRMIQVGAVFVAVGVLLLIQKYR